MSHTCNSNGQLPKPKGHMYVKEKNNKVKSENMQDIPTCKIYNKTLII